MLVNVTTVLLAERNRLRVASLEAALNAQHDLAVVAEALDEGEAVRLAAEARPDVSLVDSALAAIDATSSWAQIKAAHPEGRLVVVSDRADPTVLHEAVRAGADGYACKDRGLDALFEAIRRVHAGQAVVPPDMLADLLRELTERRRHTDKALFLYLLLTEREKQVFELLVEGCTPRVVAEILVISPLTARTHIQKVMEKLGVHSRLELTAFAIEHELVNHPIRTSRA